MNKIRDELSVEELLEKISNIEIKKKKIIRSV